LLAEPFLRQFQCKMRQPMYLDNTHNFDELPEF
jgi:hypothetical protein